MSNINYGKLSNIRLHLPAKGQESSLDCIADLLTGLILSDKEYISNFVQIDFFFFFNKLTYLMEVSVQNS